MTFTRHYDLCEPLDDLWEVLPNEQWSFESGRLSNRGPGPAEIYLRPCSGYGDRLTWRFHPGAVRRGRFVFGFLVGFEFIRGELDLTTGDLAVHTHEYHKAQPRLTRRVTPPAHTVELIRVRDDLPGLPYEGSRVILRLDDVAIAEVRHIDYLPESLVMFGLHGPGDAALASFTLTGPERPRPEYVHVAAWQQTPLPTTAANVDALLEGVRRAAEVGAAMLITPETSLTGLRIGSPDLDNESEINAQLARFGRGVAAIANAPYTLVGYPAWVSGAEVDGSELERVKINRHVFVRPDGSLGPPMAKVHSCEQGLWHGRSYNLQRVAGVEVAVGICHDGHYQDVWATGVMGGARLCVHPAAGGSTPTGRIDDLRRKLEHNPGAALGSFWVHTNAYGPAAIYYPAPNAKVRNPLLAVSPELTTANPSYPDFRPMGNQLVHANVRLWDAAGAYPLRTLRSGRAGYAAWSRLVPELVTV